MRKLVLPAALAALVSVSCRTTGPPEAYWVGRVLVVRVEGPIVQSTAESVHRHLSNAKGRCDAVVFKIDVAGGLVHVATGISEEIKRLSPTPTVAFVSGSALSPGALIAISTDRIYMKHGSFIGGTEGYIVGADGLPMQLPKGVEEKLSSGTRATFHAIAESKGHPTAIAEAIADRGTGVKKVDYEGKVQYLTENQIGEIESDKTRAGKLKVLETLCPKGKVLMLTAEEAVRCGLARKVVKNVDAVLSVEGLGAGTCPSRKLHPAWTIAGDREEPGFPPGPNRH